MAKNLQMFMVIILHIYVYHDLVIEGMHFFHIHVHTYKQTSPDDKKRNQMDHAAIHKK